MTMNDNSVDTKYIGMTGTRMGVEKHESFFLSKLTHLADLHASKLRIMSYCTLSSPSSTDPELTVNTYISSPSLS